MSVGYAAGKDAIDSRAGGLAVQVRDLFAQLVQFNTFITSKSQDELVALGYSTDDVSTLQNAFGQLTALVNVANGQQTVASANNFLFFSSQLTGPN